MTIASYVRSSRLEAFGAVAAERFAFELPVSHRYEYFDAFVTRPPLFNPQRRTA